MELGDSSKKSRFSSYERVAAISLVVLAVAFPLYIDHRPESELEDEEVGWGLRGGVGFENQMSDGKVGGRSCLSLSTVGTIPTLGRLKSSEGTKRLWNRIKQG
ncbi:hypothetical protein JHK84_043836 [Glycine max]|nr:hypothetical protein JHK84_043836 [Glycine max]